MDWNAGGWTDSQEDG
jgi:hypothetical protein